MELSHINFKYKIKDKTFPYIAYRFNVLSDAKSKDQVIELAKSSLHDLENILDTLYTEKGSTKEEDGELTSSRIEYGYKYTNSPAEWQSKKKTYSTGLFYEIFLGFNGEPKDLSLNLSNSDSDPERLWRIYDSVIALPGLKISNNAQLQINRINMLRSNNFEMNNYLSLCSHNPDE